MTSSDELLCSPPERLNESMRPVACGWRRPQGEVLIRSPLGDLAKSNPERGLLLEEAPLDLGGSGKVVGRESLRGVACPELEDRGMGRALVTAYMTESTWNSGVDELQVLCGPEANERMFAQSPSLYLLPTTKNLALIVQCSIPFDSPQIREFNSESIRFLPPHSTD